jgi:hypothetical protein
LFIQGTLANNINIFSEITVFDRQNIEKILSEQKMSLSGSFSDNDYIRIGQLINAQYILVGTLFNISPVEITLQLSISNTETGERKASFVKNCTVEDIRNASILNEATLQLLALLGVNLTAKGEQTLLSAKISTNNAETALSKGIVAQRKGTIVEAMSYYYEAASYNPALTEAANRLSAISASVKTGNIGADARNAIEEREAWASILAQCDEYFSNHLPVEITYNPTLKQTNINYENKTVDLQFSLSSYPSENIAIIQNILAGLKKTGKKEEWGFKDWPVRYKSYVDTIEPEYINTFFSKEKERPSGMKNTVLDIVLVNDQNKVISTIKVDIENTIRFRRTLTIEDFLLSPLAMIFPPAGLMMFFNSLTSGINFSKIEISSCEKLAVFKNVNAYDITNKLTIKILSINGIDAETAMKDGYVRIVTQGGKNGDQ